MFIYCTNLIELKVHSLDPEQFSRSQKWTERSSADFNLTLVNKSEQVAHIN